MTGGAAVNPVENMLVKQEPIDLELSTWNNIAARFTPRKDKALKRGITEAMHLDGALPGPTLEDWLKFYCPPNSPLEHHHERMHEHDREHAELVARDAAKKAAKKIFKSRAYFVTSGVPKGAKLRFQPQNSPQFGPLTRKEQRREQDLRAQEYARVSRRIPHFVPLRSAALRGGGLRVNRKIRR
ncbi:hypothetical protein B0H14DRAFT_2563242 [Mycena olivaceomarginata]|nr:hypothetical protein B0H14DRAFT_2563242 [Mycena olivaceomarginata]